MKKTEQPRREFPQGRTVRRGSERYWGLVEQYGVPDEDRDLITCEGDNGYGPCGKYTEWGNGRCASGHKIEFAEV